MEDSSLSGTSFSLPNLVWSASLNTDAWPYLKSDPAQGCITQHTRPTLASHPHDNLVLYNDGQLAPSTCTSKGLYRPIPGTIQWNRLMQQPPEVRLSSSQLSEPHSPPLLPLSSSAGGDEPQEKGDPHCLSSSLRDRMAGPRRAQSSIARVDALAAFLSLFPRVR